jgi:hypothetical protein
MRDLQKFMLPIGAAAGLFTAGLMILTQTAEGTPQEPSGPGPAMAEAAAGAGAKAGKGATLEGVGATLRHPIVSYSTGHEDQSSPGEAPAAPVRAGAAAAELRPVPRPKLAAERPKPRPGLKVAVSTRSSSASPSGADFRSGPRPLPRPTPGRRPLSPAEMAQQRLLVAEAASLVEAPPTTLRGAGDLACLAVSIYHEARDQPRLGQRAVASVILRRVEVPRWGETVCEVVQPVQFSYLSPDRSFPPLLEGAAWRNALTVAVEALVEGPMRVVAEADHYHASYVDPDWRREMLEVERIGAHIFYRDPRSRGLSSSSEPI